MLLLFLPLGWPAHAFGRLGAAQSHWLDPPSYSDYIGSCTSLILYEVL